MTIPQRDSIWTRPFALLCLAQFLGYAQQQMLSPTFPLYATHLGSSPFVVGLIIASFSITSVLLRPLIGDWTDRWSEAGVLITGLLVLAVTVLLCFVPRVEAMILANCFRGIGWAALNTAGYALLASSAPVSRRGEAAGYYGGAQSSATILFPALALWLIDAPMAGFQVVFVFAAALAFLGAMAGVLLVPRIPRIARVPHVGRSTAWWSEALNLLDREVLLPTALLLCFQLSLPAMTGFLVLYARAIGISDIAWYFVIAGATSLLARPVLGRMSDQLGRGPSLAAGFALQIAALSLLVTVSHTAGLLILGSLYMLGNSIGSATTLALAVERADPRRRGRAMATFSVAFPLGTAVGALLIGTAVDVAGYFWMFLMVAGFAASGLGLTLWSWRTLK